LNFFAGGADAEELAADLLADEVLGLDALTSGDTVSSF